jgi:hypothetical protein
MPYKVWENGYVQYYPEIEQKPLTEIYNFATLD